MLEHQQQYRPEHIRVWIEDVATKTPLKEYECKTYNEDVSCYIASDNEHLFSVNVELNDTSECLSCEIYIDGQCVRGCLFGKSDPLCEGVCKSLHIEEIDGGPGHSIPLRFGRARVSDDYGIEDQKMCDKLGTIMVKILRSKRLSPVPGYRLNIKKDQIYNIESINPLKIHGAKFVAEPTVKNWSYWDAESIDAHRPLATFTFKYRSTVSLELMGILPRTFPKDIDVMKDDLSRLDPQTKKRAVEMQWIEENIEKLKKKKIAKEKTAAEKHAADKRIATMAAAERLKQQKLASAAQRVTEAKNFVGSAAKTYGEGYERRAAKVVAPIGNPSMKTYK